MADQYLQLSNMLKNSSKALQQCQLALSGKDMLDKRQLRDARYVINRENSDRNRSLSDIGQDYKNSLLDQKQLVRSTEIHSSSNML